MRLGDLGTQHSDEEISFGWFGVDIRVDPGFGQILVNEWVAEYGELDEDNLVKASGATQQLMRMLVCEEDFDRFWSLAKKHNQNDSDFSTIMEKVIEAQADRPTQQPSDSSAGRKLTAAKSKGGFSSPAIERLEASGRADLAVIHAQAERARAG